MVGVRAMLAQVFWSGWSSPRAEGEALERFSAVERCFGDGLLIHSIVMPSLLRAPFPIDVVFILSGMAALLRCCWKKKGSHSLSGIITCLMFSGSVSFIFACRAPGPITHLAVDFSSCSLVVL